MTMPEQALQYLSRLYNAPAGFTVLEGALLCSCVVAMPEWALQCATPALQSPLGHYEAPSTFKKLV